MHAAIHVRGSLVQLIKRQTFNTFKLHVSRILPHLHRSEQELN